MSTYLKNIGLIVMLCAVGACNVGPRYVRPPVEVTAQFKEAPQDWKIATPQDEADRGTWWTVFNDPLLNDLEDELNRENQTILTAAANYRVAKALVDEARAGFFPTLTGAASITRQKRGSSGSSSFISTSTSGTTSSGVASTGGSTSSSSSTTSTITNSHALVLDALWEPDIWGAVRNTVAAASAGAQASKALLAATRLSAQATLAQFYFELRALDTDQALLDQIVTANQQLLSLTQHQYTSGIVSQINVAQAQGQLDDAQAQAINNGINRALYEHAIAVLTGHPPAALSLPPNPLTARPPLIPGTIPSALLERRPDIAEAERFMAQANANIGVAIAAYFPALDLSATASIAGPGLSHWFSLPALSWALSPELIETFYDGGLRKATVAATRAQYKANVAAYRQTVLIAFEDVEDNLAALRILKAEEDAQNRAKESAKLAQALTTHQYHAGTVAYSEVLTAKIATYTAEKAAADTVGLQTTTTVGLIKALGGGWTSIQDKI